MIEGCAENRSGRELGLVRMELEKVLEGLWEYQQLTYDSLLGAIRSMKEGRGVDTSRELKRIGGQLRAFSGAQGLVWQACLVLAQIAESGVGGDDLFRHYLSKVHRQLEVYCTPGLPPFQLDWIDGRILAGRNPLTELDVEWLNLHGVTHVLDLREPWEWDPEEGRYGEEAIKALGPKRQHFPVEDMAGPSLRDLDVICAYIDEVLSIPSSRLYIHCRAGKERTGAVLVAYYGRKLGLTYEEALAFVKARRPIIKLLPGQEQTVRQWLNAHRR